MYCSTRHPLSARPDLGKPVVGGFEAGRLSRRRLPHPIFLHRVQARVGAQLQARREQRVRAGKCAQHRGARAGHEVLHQGHGVQRGGGSKERERDAFGTETLFDYILRNERHEKVY